MIPRKQFDAYNKAVTNLSDGAARRIESGIWAWLQTDEGKAASVAECREYAKGVMSGVIQGYDEAAASLAAQWYDKQAEDNHFKLPDAVTATVYDPKRVDETARYQAKKLVKGDLRGFAKYCGELGRDDVLRSLNETIIKNAGRDKKRGVRFARVPTGAETCTFCLMLASRGAVYHTRKTAGEFRHFHRRCDCKVVPGFGGDPDAELVEGIKPKELYLRYRALEQIDSMDAISAADREEFKSRAMTVDFSVLAGEKLGSVEYDKPRSLLEEHEKAGVDYLALNGFNVKTVPEDPKAPANLDISIDGALWEMKNLTNSASSASNQVKRARIKWFKLGISQPMTCVFTNEGNKGSFDETCNALDARRRRGEVFLVVSENGVVRVLKDK